MKRLVFGVLVPVLLAGCSGLEIKSITPNEVIEARNPGGKSLDGYVLYEPIILVEVSVKETCVAGKDEKGGCKAPPVIQCAASTPFLLPDYSKPYLMRSRNGFGKAGIDVAISDGWRLGSIKDNSDNTAVLGTLEKALGLKSIASSKDGKTCKEPGLYRITLDDKGVPTLVDFKLYY